MQPTTDWSGSAQQRRTDPGGCPSPTEGFAYAIPYGTRAMLRKPGWRKYTTTKETVPGPPVSQQDDVIIFEKQGWQIKVTRQQLQLRHVARATKPR